MKNIVTATVIAGVLAGSAALAQNDGSAQVKARQGQMRVIALNLGVLGGMAQGKIDYDAEAAQNAADSLAGVAMIHQPTLWIEGTSNADREGTKALPAIWEDNADFMTKWDAFVTAANDMQSAAGTGKDALGPAMGGLGDACKACHEKYQQSDD
ncbi:c-type cytochrome [Primorskyibacter flagellatus]|uniref:Cytochrome c556 n=1 Tax=Primorskyibacter flagellatus TaxID=1387277 RepID=A0A1W2BQH7_9RHOB|nr:cytochrome c [Primorskyibacter flagellatus]SMC74872.1 Cytochrome c556 [Primorskyibacter flagellatus]